MRKEVAMAILIGLGIGLLIAFGIITARTALKRQAEVVGITPTPTPENGALTPETKPDKHRLTVSTPLDNQVVSEDQIVLSGSTTPGSTVAVTTEDDDYLVEADDTGTFSQSVPLIGGANLIHVVSFSPQGEEIETQLTVVYTTAEF